MQNETTTSYSNDQQPKREPRVFRSFALPVPAFDHMKEYQRAYHEKHGVWLNNNYILTVILAEHKEMILNAGK